MKIALFLILALMAIILFLAHRRHWISNRTFNGIVGIAAIIAAFAALAVFIVPTAEQPKKAANINEPETKQHKSSSGDVTLPQAKSTQEKSGVEKSTPNDDKPNVHASPPQPIPKEISLPRINLKGFSSEETEVLRNLLINLEIVAADVSLYDSVRAGGKNVMIRVVYKDNKVYEDNFGVPTNNIAQIVSRHITNHK